MKITTCFIIILLSPIVIFAQEWQSAVVHINDNRNEIEQITFLSNNEQYEEHIDSILIISNSAFKELKIELYTSIIDSEDAMEYVAAMQIPISRLTKVIKSERSIQLGFLPSDSYEKKSALDFLCLSIPEERDLYTIHAAFNHLKHLNLVYHPKKPKTDSSN